MAVSPGIRRLKIPTHGTFSPLVSFPLKARSKSSSSSPIVGLVLICARVLLITMPSYNTH